MLSWMMATAMAADLAGAWTLQTPEKEVRAAIDASADKAVSALPGMFQSKAKGRLLGHARICDRYTVRITIAEVAWACGAKDEFVVAREKLGKPFMVKRDGKRAEALVTLEDGRLSATFSGANGKRSVVFTLDGEVLVAESALHGDKLASPLVWTSRYRRPAAP
jgi:hypothetical protein